ncbi:MAG: hypothetical protein AB1762_20325 [Gemmatimonadota bacterium]
MNTNRSIFAFFASVAAIAACSAGSPTAPVTARSASTFSSGESTAARSIGATIRVRCEVRSGERSKISVDGNNLTPLNMRWSAVVSSGFNVASAPAQTAIGDEVEFDFDSNPADIAAGATAIARNFIWLRPGTDVSAKILDASGAVVVAGAAECAAR